MKVVIMGCGRVGARVAAVLDHNGHEVTVIDINSRAFRRLPDEFHGRTLIGTGIDEDVLKRAGITDAAAFIAVTNGDNRNIMAAQVARNIFAVPEVICRIYDPVREDTYRRLGLTTVCPTTVISAQILDHVMSASTLGA
ncbi:MAG: TrkA family potassium uptake protein [Thermomicrobiales bacterium]|nr:TrkA family potassium uptake protein [Thermomicrobiales bacterium]MCO5222510.1 TrkA family potassium uptake protein [Thermomicrobiales bacterium]